MNKFMLILLFLTFISCGKTIENLQQNSVKIQKVDPVDEEKFSYELLGIACTTGKHTFSRHADACTRLKDHELNNNCAEEEREELFLSESCGGLFDS